MTASCALPLSARRLVVVSGKGGVGKTTIAAALARGLAARGAPTLLAELDGADAAARLLGCAPGTGADAPQPAGGGLWRMGVRADAALTGYLRRQLRVRPVADRVAASASLRAFVEAAPGLEALLCIGQVVDLAAGRWAHVVLDAPATGHALAMLRAPRTYAAATRAGPVAAGARDVAALLADPARTAIVLVTAPEELAVTESAAFREGLRDATGRDADLLVVNRRLASPFAEDDAAALRGITGDPVADSALWLHEAAAAQDGQVGRLDTELGGLPRAALPFWFCAHPGTHELDDAVARLEAVL